MALALSLTLLPTAAWAEEPAQAAQLADGYCFVVNDRRVERSALTDKDLTGKVTVERCTEHDYGTAKNCIYCDALNPDSMEAAIGETRYGTLEEALAALKDGDTLTLLSDRAHRRAHAG